MTRVSYKAAAFLAVIEVSALALTVPVLATPAVHHTHGEPQYQPAPPQNRFTAANGFSMMHGDTASSDTTPVSGPAPGEARIRAYPLGEVCPSVLVGSDGVPLAICTKISTRQPTVNLLDPTTGMPEASLSVKAGSSALGGVYTYLDNHNRVVMVNGASDLLRITHHKTAAGWRLSVTSSISLGKALTKECGSATCDTVVGLTPDRAGRVWFATAHGLIGVVQPGTKRIATLQLPAGEIIGNSISTLGGRTAAVTDKALYLLDFRHGQIRLLWRRAYQRQGPRKPGQLTDGSGTTPVFFGPHRAEKYLAIVDDARPREHLLVFRLPHRQAPDADRPHLTCRLPVLTNLRQSGTEDAPIGYDRTVIVTDTYGYPYPAGTSGASKPTKAPFRGGMTRVDVRRSGGCVVRWDRAIRSAGLPRLSLRNGQIQTVISTPASADETNVYGDTYYYATISAQSGRVIAQQRLGTGPAYDALQMVGTTTPQGVMYQGTLTGFVRIAPAR